MFDNEIKDIDVIHDLTKKTRECEFSWLSEYNADVYETEYYDNVCYQEVHRQITCVEEPDIQLFYVVQLYTYRDGKVETKISRFEIESYIIDIFNTQQDGSYEIAVWELCQAIEETFEELDKIDTSYTMGLIEDEFCLLPKVLDDTKNNECVWTVGTEYNKIIFFAEQKNKQIYTIDENYLRGYAEFSGVEVDFTTDIEGVKRWCNEEQFIRDAVSSDYWKELLNAIIDNMKKNNTYTQASEKVLKLYLMKPLENKVLPIPNHLVVFGN